MKLVLIICAFLIVGFNTSDHTFAQEPIRIHSKVLNEKRELHIHLPENYDQLNLKYPVLYILDGGYLVNDWPDQPSFARHIDSLSSAGKIPEIIAVGIANVNRIRDFNPTFVEEYPTSGGANNFLEFFHNELIPYMDQNYRTSGKRILFGHSAGGMLAIYSLLSNPEIFQHYILTSPALSWDDDYVVKMAKTKLPKMELSQSIFMHMFIGEKDHPRFIASTNLFVELLKQRKPNRLKWEIKTYPNLGHNPVAHFGFVDGLQACFIN